MQRPRSERRYLLHPSVSEAAGAVNLRKVKLGFFSGRSCSLVGDEVRTDAGTGRLIDALAAEFDAVNVTLAACPTPFDIHDHSLTISRQKLVPLPFMPSYARAVPHFRACRRVINELESKSDVLVVQLPFQVPAALLFGRRPRVYHLCADVRSIANSSPQYRGMRRAAAWMMGTLIHAIQDRLVHEENVRVVANGAALLHQYRDALGRSVVSATIRRSEIMSVQRKRPADAPFRVLFVGFLRPEKGIDVLMEALELFLARHQHAELAIAGATPVLDRGVSTELAQRFRSLEAAGKVVFLGELNYGPALFGAFADADVLVVPSRSEGTPRVLVEARAFGCPVIASNVGGIPTSVQDGVDGLLVPPGDVEALCAALSRLADDPALRKRLIAAGLDRVRSLTVESFAANMLEEVRVLLAGNAEV
jgi:glycosyltransferase involved in cell wall biosynthesis